MRKKIAAFAIGWGGEIVQEFFEGVKKGMGDYDADVYLFLPFPLWSDAPQHRAGELNILNLPVYEDYDGALILGNGMDFPGSYDLIIKKCKAAGIPIVSASKNVEGVYYTYSDNYPGMVELTEHLIAEHKTEKIIFISGSQENPDCQVRYKAIYDVCKKHGIKFDETCVFESEWSPPAAESYIRDYLDQGCKLPDVFMCANDTLAMTVCGELRKHGVLVPRDVKVTGFDADGYARAYDPAITSVNQNMEELGVLSAKTMVDILQGKKRADSQSIPSSMSHGESCACTISSEEYDNYRRLLGRLKYEEHQADIYFDGEFLAIEKWGRGIEYFNQIAAGFCEAFKNGSFFEKTFAQIMLDASFKKSVASLDHKLKTKGYSNRMIPVLVMEDSRTYMVDEIPTSQLLAKYPEDGKPHFFVIVPLHEDDNTFGYAVLQDHLESIGKNFNLSRYKDRMSSIFSKLRDGLILQVLHDRLAELSETDALTKVKSRTSYETLLKSVNAKLSEDLLSNTSFAIAMFDINNLKDINDAYGHDAGDEYIINCCRYICNHFTHSPIYRIGGDEFLAFLQEKDYEDREALIRKFRAGMNAFNDESIPPVQRVSVASGIGCFELNSDSKMDDVVKRADKKMYENKMMIKGSAR